MENSILKMVREFKLFWKSYILQSFFAAIIISILLLLLHLQHLIVIASIGSTAFIVFAMPGNITAKPRNVIGGHLVGLLSGSLSALIQNSFPVHPIILYSFAVGLSIFIMVVTDTEHPPASGTALGVAITGFSLDVTIAIIISVTILSLVHHFLKFYLKDLT